VLLIFKGEVAYSAKEAKIIASHFPKDDKIVVKAQVKFKSYCRYWEEEEDWAISKIVDSRRECMCLTHRIRFMK
jgi:hypothetical protein